MDWNKTAQQVHDLVRGTSPWPGAYTFLNESKMRVWKTCVSTMENNQSHLPGEIVKVDDNGLLVKCSDGYIVISELQFDSSKRMKVSDYLRGHKISIGEKLGN